MKKVVVITTGGSIATKHGPMVGGAVPAVKGEGFLSMLPRNEVEVLFKSFSNLPGSHLSPAKMLEVSQLAGTILAAPDVDGVVVTHGTDTLEETAYMLDLTLQSPKPVAVTGAVRGPTVPVYDGMANLVSAIRVAMQPDVRGMGALVVFNDQIFAASEVQQMHSNAINCFDSPGYGPLGSIEGNRVWLQRKLLRRTSIACTQLEERVDLIRVTQGADDRQLRHAIQDGVAGIVLEVFGSGRVPPWWLPAINDAIQQQITVVVVSRSLMGSLYDQYGYVGAYHDLERLGVIFANGLDGIKARIKLMVALGAARKPEEVRAWFQG